MGCYLRAHRYARKHAGRKARDERREDGPRFLRWGAQQQAFARDGEGGAVKARGCAKTVPNRAAASPPSPARAMLFTFRL
jgi:hypothetical protein